MPVLFSLLAPSLRPKLVLNKLFRASRVLSSRGTYVVVVQRAAGRGRSLDFYSIARAAQSRLGGAALTSCSGNN